MKMKHHIAVAAILLGSAGSAHAQGLYLSVGAGMSMLQDADNTNDTPRVDVKSSYDTGWMVTGAIGYGFANGLRVEGEIGYRQVEVDQLDIRDDGGLGAALGGPSLNGLETPAAGNETALSVMANVWYDINTGTPVTPYVGGGIGVARITLDNLRVAGITIVDDHDNVFAYQLGAGVAYAVSQQVSLTLDYRFFQTADAEFTDIAGDFKSEFTNHSVAAGVRVRF